MGPSKHCFVLTIVVIIDQDRRILVDSGVSKNSCEPLEWQELKGSPVRDLGRWKVYCLWDVSLEIFDGRPRINDNKASVLFVLINPREIYEFGQFLSRPTKF